MKGFMTKIFHKSEERESSIHRAASGGKLESVRYLVEECRANVEENDVFIGYNPLHYASDKGHIEIVKYLIEQCHANVEAKNNSGWNTLHFATWNGHNEVINYLKSLVH